MHVSLAADVVHVCRVQDVGPNGMRDVLASRPVAAPQATFHSVTCFVWMS